MASKLLVALRVPAKPQRAFEAFVYEIAEWWRPNGLFDFTVGRRGRIAFEPGAEGRLTETYEDGSVFEVGRITAWEPPALLAFTWRQASFSPDQLTEVRVTFEPAGEETRISVEHAGWDVIPQRHAARHGFPLDVFQTRHAEWWRLLLVSLRTAVRQDPEKTDHG
jgi:uncharacterized protein YndB with AHSA1/START domain